MKSYDISPICSTNEQLSTTMIEKIQDDLITEYTPKPKKIQRKTKKELQP